MHLFIQGFHVLLQSCKIILSTGKSGVGGGNGWFDLVSAFDEGELILELGGVFIKIEALGSGLDCIRRNRPVDCSKIGSPNLVRSQSNKNSTLKRFRNIASLDERSSRLGTLDGIGFVDILLVHNVFHTDLEGLFGEACFIVESGILMEIPDHLYLVLQGVVQSLLGSHVVEKSDCLSIFLG